MMLRILNIVVEIILNIVVVNHEKLGLVNVVRTLSR